MSVDLQVRRDDWSRCRFVETETPEEPAPGEVLFRVDRFALTSNNITYAAAGDLLDYWGFFPAEEGWGHIPVMGFADVARSRHPGVAEGERCFGFFPMATHLLVQADRVGEAGFSDAAAHRAKHAPAYRQYSRSAADELYDAAREDQILLLRGLYATSFLVDDHLADADDFGSRRFVVSSASSKTAIALAYQLSRRGAGQVVGLTSPRNAEFVEGLGYYDRVLAYGDVESLDPGTPTVFVDHAGDGELVNTLHHHVGEAVRSSIIIGATHWNAAGRRSEDLPGAAPTLFFAPAQIQKRSAEWGPRVFQQRLAEGFRGFSEASDAWLKVVRGTGREALEQSYRRLLAGEAHPSEGHVLSLWD